MDNERIDIWCDEGGLMLMLERLPNGKITVSIKAPNADVLVGAVTIARFRHQRIAAFFAPEETEEQHRKAVEHVRGLIQEATDAG